MSNITLIGERLEDFHEKALKERFLEDKRILIDKVIAKPSWLDYIPFSSYFRSSFRSSLNKNEMQWLIWNLGNFSTLSSKFSDTNTFLLTTKEKLTKLKQNYKIILLYNTVMQSHLSKMNI